MIAPPMVNPVSADIMPDSRATTVLTPVGAVWRGGAYWVPIYCGSCGKAGGLVPEENITFAAWLCDPCSEKYGEQLGLMKMPDEVFWETVKQEQLAKYGRLLSPEELETIVAADASPLATLIKQGRA